MPTDREIAKVRREGQLATFGLASAPSSTVIAEESRQRDFLKTGTENAATNVAEAPCFCIERKSKVKAVTFVEAANIATDNTDFLHLKVYKRSGETKTLLAQFNTHGGGQGAVTRWTRMACSLNTTSDNHVLDANTVLTYELIKGGNGKALSANTPISFDFEEV